MLTSTSNAKKPIGTQTTNFYYETVIVIADEVVDVNKENKTYASEETLGDVVAVRSYKDSDKYEINYTFLNNR